jgi:hypothetical protein
LHQDPRDKNRGFAVDHYRKLPTAYLTVEPVQPETVAGFPGGARHSAATNSGLGLLTKAHENKKSRSGGAALFAISIHREF